MGLNLSLKGITMQGYIAEDAVLMMRYDPPMLGFPVSALPLRVKEPFRLRGFLLVFPV